MTRRRLVPVFVLAALIAIDGARRWWGEPRRPDSATASTLRLLAPPVPLRAFTAVDLEGRPVTSGDWAGRFALINVWATWCVPCRVEIPDLVALQAAHGDVLQVIGVLLDDVSVEEARRFTNAMGVNYPVLFSTWDVEAALGETLVLPTSYLVNPGGAIMATQVGPIDPQTVLRLIGAGPSLP